MARIRRLLLACLAAGLTVLLSFLTHYATKGA